MYGLQQQRTKTFFSVETHMYQELNNDQRRETVNTNQRFASFLSSQAKRESYKGSMVWRTTSNGTELLMHSYYDERTGVRKQKSLGARVAETERIRTAFEEGKVSSQQRFQAARDAMDRQAAINRALKLGRVPTMTAEIIRTLDSANLLGKGIKIIGTNALYAYEAAAGIFFEANIVATGDIDLLFDARSSVQLSAVEAISERTILGLLKSVDSSFERTGQAFKAQNQDGYIVDLIKPVPNPPWRPERGTVTDNPDDLSAAEIVGLSWYQSAPPFEATAIDEKGHPVRIVTIDPRAFAVYKLWLSKREDREAIKRRRDESQAEAVANVSTKYFAHLPFSESDLRMFPKPIVKEAARLFENM